MLPGKIARITVVAVLAVVAGLLFVWSNDASRDSVSRQSQSNPPRDAAREALAPAPAAISPGAPNVSAVKQPGFLVELHGPSDVTVGEVFQARVDIEVNTPVRELVFSIAYDKSLLRLVGRSEGELVRQRGPLSQFEVDEPSDGNVQGVLRTLDAAAAMGSGSIAVFEFEAVKPGTATLELQNVMTMGADGETNSNFVTQERVTIH